MDTQDTPDIEYSLTPYRPAYTAADHSDAAEHSSAEQRAAEQREQDAARRIREDIAAAWKAANAAVAALPADTPVIERDKVWAVTFIAASNASFESYYGEDYTPMAVMFEHQRATLILDTAQRIFDEEENLPVGKRRRKVFAEIFAYNTSSSIRQRYSERSSSRPSYLDVDLFPSLKPGEYTQAKAPTATAAQIAVYERCNMLTGPYAGHSYPLCNYDAPEAEETPQQPQASTYLLTPEHEAALAAITKRSKRAETDKQADFYQREAIGAWLLLTEGVDVLLDEDEDPQAKQARRKQITEKYREHFGDRREERDAAGHVSKFAGTRNATDAEGREDTTPATLAGNAQAHEAWQQEDRHAQKADRDTDSRATFKWKVRVFFSDNPTLGARFEALRNVPVEEWTKADTDYFYRAVAAKQDEEYLRLWWDYCAPNPSPVCDEEGMILERTEADIQLTKDYFAAFPVTSKQSMARQEQQRKAYAKRKAKQAAAAAAQPVTIAERSSAESEASRV